MKKKSRVINSLIFLMFIVLIVFFGFNYLFTPVIVEELSYIDDYKTISVNFNQDIIINKKTLEGISVIDSKENVVPLNLQLDDSSKKLIIKPSESQYSLGESYQLVIDEIQARWFGSIKNKHIETFTIDKIPIDKSLRLGRFMTQRVSNERNYEWYVDQGTTGEFSYTNCGPTCAEMAGRWVDKNFEGSAEEARNLDYCDDGGWYTENIKNYLDKYDINSIIIPDVSEKLITSNIDKGNIIILGIKADEISYNDSIYGGHVNMVYSMYGGHFILIKGYVIADGILYFEVYDPNSSYETYEDGTPLGKDRYYRADEVVKASKDWYDSILLIEK